MIVIAPFIFPYFCDKVSNSAWIGIFSSLKYFAIFSAFADFGLYVIAVKQLGVIKENISNGKYTKEYLGQEFWKFVGTRIVIMSVIYLFALLLAYFLPAYSSNPYLIRGLPIWMAFSASFMTAGILQLPLQIFWKMEKLSIALIFARIVQISILIGVVYLFFIDTTFDWSQKSIFAFCGIIISVLASGITQGFYIRHTSQKILPLRIRFDVSFIKNILKKNRQYGLSYFLSSFHTLIVLIFLSLYFPTSQKFEYTGIRALALALIEIFLIVPSALGNSMLHKVSAYTLTQKRESFWNFFKLIFWIWWIVFINFFFFNTEIIQLMGSERYLGTGFMNPGSNTILPFLAVVLRLSFLKQVFNYIFVATDNQNMLLWINLLWVSIWISVGVYLIPLYNIPGGIVTQILLEILFVAGAFFIALRKKVFPIIDTKKILTMAAYLLWSGLLGRWIFKYSNIIPRLNIHNIAWIITIIFVSIGTTIGIYMKFPLPQLLKKTHSLIIIWAMLAAILRSTSQFTHYQYFITVAFAFNVIIIAAALPTVKQVARGLTNE